MSDRYRREWDEWHAIQAEMRADGADPSPYDVTREWRKRMLARGERPMTYEEIVADLEPVK